LVWAKQGRRGECANSRSGGGEVLQKRNHCDLKMEQMQVNPSGCLILGGGNGEKMERKKCPPAAWVLGLETVGRPDWVVS